MNDGRDSLEIPWFLRQNPQEAKQEMIQEAAQKLTAEIQTVGDQDGLRERYLVIAVAGNPMRYIYIPDEVPDLVIEAAVAKLNE